MWRSSRLVASRHRSTDALRFWINNFAISIFSSHSSTDIYYSHVDAMLVCNGTIYFKSFHSYLMYQTRVLYTCCWWSILIKYVRIAKLIGWNLFRMLHFIRCGYIVAYTNDDSGTDWDDSCGLRYGTPERRSVRSHSDLSWLADIPIYPCKYMLSINNEDNDSGQTTNVGADSFERFVIALLLT